MSELVENAPTSQVAERPNRVLLSLEDSEDETVLRALVGDSEYENWDTERVGTIDEGLYCLRDEAFDIWIVDSQLATNAGVDLVELVQSENIEAALILLVSGDHPFAPAADMIDWAYVLVREEVSSQNAIDLIRGAVSSQREKVAKSRLVRRDPLTGLLNRVGVGEFISRTLRQAEEEHRRFGVFVIDIDGYEGVLRRYGKTIGDELIRAAGRRLMAGIPPGGGCWAHR